MAIEKTVFTSATGDAMATEIAAWLTANASDFFDEIEVVSGPRVYCNIDGVRAVDINTSNDGASSVSIKNGIYSVGNFIGTGWLYGIKTSKGIALYHTSRGCFMATKTNEDTVSVAVKNISSGTQYACADFDNSSNFVTFSAPTRVGSNWIQSGKTVLAPIVNANALTYADGLYLQVYSQYPNVEGIFTINGKQYYTDGVLALEG
jgi:hypothetical protein